MLQFECYKCIKCSDSETEPHRTRPTKTIAPHLKLVRRPAAPFKTDSLRLNFCRQSKAQNGQHQGYRERRSIVQICQQKGEHSGARDGNRLEQFVIRYEDSGQCYCEDQFEETTHFTA